MDKALKIKKMFIIGLGFALSAYLIKSGLAMLDVANKTDTNNTKVELGYGDKN